MVKYFDSGVSFMKNQLDQSTLLNQTSQLLEEAKMMQIAEHRAQTNLRCDDSQWRFWRCTHFNNKFIAAQAAHPRMSPQSFHKSMFDKFKDCLHKSESHVYTRGQLNFFAIFSLPLVSTYVSTHPTMDRSYGGESFFCFRDGIMPLWEDEYNFNGGCWSLKISTSVDGCEIDEGYIKSLWLKLIQLVSSSELAPYLEEICGVCLTVRKLRSGTHCKVSLWNRDSSKFFINLRIGEIFKEFLQLTGTLQYQSHSTNMSNFAVTALRRFSRQKRSNSMSRQAYFSPEMQHFGSYRPMVY